jgi:2-oxoglutarate/2-oxoacid ferredoxin oxidoreductase subunit alpha
MSNEQFMKPLLMQGNEACARGAITAGCRFYGGYPITPSSEIMEYMASQLPKVGGVFAQMEDEIASIAAVIGASWAGAKAMTATSGPGFTLMLENIGYAIMTETPCVIVDVQRAGPSTGQATKPGSGDLQQVRWGASGDYEIIALSPWSVQEMYEFIIRAFNLAETYRVPTFLMADEAVGHLKEKVILDPNITIVPRAAKSNLPPFGHPLKQGENPANADFKDTLPTPMPTFGQGRKLLVTGSTHDINGYRKTQDPNTHARLVNRFCNKIRAHQEQIQDNETYFMDDAEIVLVAYGFTARSALRAVNLLRAKKVKAGLIRLKTIWPFPDKLFESLTQQVTRVIIPEMNQGQIYRELQRCVPDRIKLVPYNKTNGLVIEPKEILGVI